MARMCRKFHDHSYSTGWDIAMYISSLFSLYVFYFSIISFGEKKQRRTKASHNEHYSRYICLILKKKKKEELKERKRNIVIKVGFYNLVYWNLFEARMYIFCLNICLLSLLLLLLLFFFFWRLRGVSNKTRIDRASLI